MAIYTNPACRGVPMFRLFSTLILVVVAVAAEAPAHALPVGDAACRKTLAGTAPAGVAGLLCTKCQSLTCTP